MRQMRWISRQFSLDLPTTLFPGVLERIRGTPARVRSRLQGLSAEVLVRLDGDSWSIQENVGHLIQVEALWHARLDDYSAGKQVLQAADMENRSTHAAGYRAQSIDGILLAFAATRGQLVERLEKLDDLMIEQSALHPRLNRPMRILDLMVFAAEHDDHHMARITELLRSFQTGK